MARSPEDLDDTMVQELILANQEAIAVLQDEIARLRMFLDLKAIKALARPDQLSDDIRRSEQILKKVGIIRSDLQVALAAAARRKNL